MPEEGGLPESDLRDQVPNFSHYIYFKVGARDQAIRILVDKRGNSVAAETIGTTSGRFVSCIGRISECGNSPYADEIDEAEFNRLVAAQVAAVREAERKAREAGEPWPPQPVILADLLARRPADPNRVVLQVARMGTWIVDVRLRENGDLAFCSGDAHREWYAIVPASEMEALRTAIVASLEPEASGTILDLVKARFSASEEAPNPFNAIKAFLTRSGITWTHDHW